MNGNICDNTRLATLPMICLMTWAISLIYSIEVSLAQPATLELPVLFQETPALFPTGQLAPRISVQSSPRHFSPNPIAAWQVEVTPSERNSSDLKMTIRIPTNIDEIEIVSVAAMEMPSIARVSIDYSDTGRDMTSQPTNLTPAKLTSTRNNTIKHIDAESIEVDQTRPIDNTTEESLLRSRNRVVKNPFFESASQAPIQHLPSFRWRPETAIPRLAEISKLPTSNSPVDAIEYLSPSRQVYSGEATLVVEGSDIDAYPTVSQQGELELLPTYDQVNLLELPSRGQQGSEENDSGIRHHFFDEKASNSSSASEEQKLIFDSAITPTSFLTPASPVIPQAPKTPVMVKFSDQ